MTFLKNDPRPCTTLKQMFLDRFELVVAHFGPPEILKWLWLHGSKCDSEGTYSTCNPPLFVVSDPQNCPNGRLDPNT